MKRICFAVIVCLFMCASTLATGEATRASEQQRIVRITPSPLMKMLRDRLKQQPRTSEQELADYANSLLAQNGFDYNFDVCEFLKLIPQKNSTQTSSQYQFQMTQADGRKVTLQIGGVAVYDGMCGECFFAFPSLSVTKREILLLVKGKQYSLKRPRLFGLDEVSLVDSTMKRVLRTWEVPQQSIPLGISEDGTRLYISTELDQLALEIAPSGISFTPLSRVEIKNGEDLKRTPKDPANAYLAFTRFRSGKKSFILRYSAPCT